MKTWHWVALIVVAAAAAFALGRYASTLKKAYDNREKLQATADILGGISTLMG